MEQFKGTKGKWNYSGTPFEVNNYGEFSIWRDHVVNGELVSTKIAETDRGNHIENQYNAALIASAPELLQACIDFVEKVDRGEARSKKSYAQMKQAINKALNLNQ